HVECASHTEATVVPEYRRPDPWQLPSLDPTSDKSIGDVLGDSSGLSKLTISSVKATHRERSFGLEPASLPKGFQDPGARYYRR
ncbi:hypothetical protein, partial [Escherichia coli]